jgi:hypothetical protein
MERFQCGGTSLPDGAKSTAPSRHRFSRPRRQNWQVPSTCCSHAIPIRCPTRRHVKIGAADSADAYFHPNLAWPGPRRADRLLGESVRILQAQDPSNVGRKGVCLAIMVGMRWQWYGRMPVRKFSNVHSPQPVANCAFGRKFGLTRPDNSIAARAMV